MHGVELEAVHAGADRRIILAELPRLGFVRDLQDRDTKGAAGCHHRAIRQQFAGGKLLFALSAMLTHQSLFLFGHIRRKCRSRRNQLEVVMPFVHGRA